jgi:hypothetical protein
MQLREPQPSFRQISLEAQLQHIVMVLLLLGIKDGSHQDIPTNRLYRSSLVKSTLMAADRRFVM